VYDAMCDSNLSGSTKETAMTKLGAIRRVVATMSAVAIAVAVAALGAASPASADFGLSQFTAAAAATQAGAHSDVTTTIGFNLKVFPDPPESFFGPFPEEDVRSIALDLPPGLIADAATAPLCARSDFATAGHCPKDTQVGNAVVTTSALFVPPDGVMPNNPIYNVTPAPGQPAALGLTIGSSRQPAYIDIGVRNDSDYHVTTTSSNIETGIPIAGLAITLWGVPADSSHDALRYDPTNSSGSSSTPGYGFPSSAPRTPFMVNGDDCDTVPVTHIGVTSYDHPDGVVAADAESPKPTGCSAPTFAPTITVTPDTTAAGAPAGLAVDIAVPQNDDPDGLATPPLRKAVVTLPDGMTINPSAADGLAACSDAQSAIGTVAAASCPEAAKIGTASVTAPALRQPLDGALYIASQQSDDPTSGKMFRFFLVADGQGVHLKLAGAVRADPATGRLTATFDDNPQVPASDISLHFDGGPRAVLATPTTCGVKTTTAQLTSWGGQVATPSNSFTIDQGCDQAGQFAPTMDAGLVDPQAGGSSAFALTLSRPNGQQDINGLEVVLPPGVLGHVGSVPRCAEAQAAAGTCDAASQIGHLTVAAGAGPSPVYVAQPGKAPTAVYLAGPYKGAPFSLSMVVPAQAGPFDLGTVVVRAALFIDPVDAHVTVQSEPIPTIVGGVPLRVQKIAVTLDRPGFMVAPTSCAPMAITGQATSAQGSAAAVSSRFQAANCAALDLKPRLALALTGKGQTTDGKHPALTTTLSMPAGGANLKQVAVTLPTSMALDPDNSASNDLCEFAAGQKTIPDCPASSVVGSATAVTPLLDQPVAGPVYFIKNERTDAKTGRQIKTYPTLAVVLQGEGVTLVLRATTGVPDNKHLVTTFDNIPDAPVSDFKLNINGGPKSILVVSGANLCAATQVAEQAADGQNGKVADVGITMSTPCTLGVVTSSHSASALKLTVGGLGAGKVSVSGKGLTKTSRTIATATTATLAPKLSAGVRASLAHGRNVKVKVTVSFTPKGAKQAKAIHKTLTIHGAKPKQ
jgi:hypothetical protein